MNAPTPAARLGLVLPGLGHLATGALVPGVALLALDVLVITSALRGLPRAGMVLAIWPWHGAAAYAALPALAGVAWWLAWRHAHPRAPDPTVGVSAWGSASRALARHPTGMLGLVGVLGLLTLTLLAPLLAPFDPDQISAGPDSAPPGVVHLFGTDRLGRDVLSRALLGARISMLVGFLAVGIAATLGTAVGAVAGWRGGRTDRALMWFVDLLLAMPRLVLLIAVAGLFRPQGVRALLVVVVLLGLTGWMGVSRIVRSEVLSLRGREFVQAAVALGMSDARILVRHLIPNALAPVIVYCSLALGATMLAEASLSFLGLGIKPPTATWGSMLADAREDLENAPWVAVLPGTAIMLAVMSFNLLGDGLRDALDPRQRGR